MSKLITVISCILSLNYQVFEQRGGRRGRYADRRVARSFRSVSPGPREIYKDLDKPLVKATMVQSQIIRSPMGLLSLPLTEAILETPRGYIDTPRAYDFPRNFIDVPIEGLQNYVPRVLEGPRIIEAPRNYIQPTILADPCNGIPPVVNIPNFPRPPSTTIITDCTPSVCKNLADTINLMVVSNLLQNTIGGEDAALRIAAPLVKDALSNPAFPNLISNFNSPNAYSPNLIAPNAVAPNFLSSNLVGSSVYDPTPFGPRVVAPNYIAPFSAPNAPINNSALLSNLLKLLGGTV